jgi:hypothetical protein
MVRVDVPCLKYGIHGYKQSRSSSLEEVHEARSWQRWSRAIVRTLVRDGVAESRQLDVSTRRKNTLAHPDDSLPNGRSDASRSVGECWRTT